MSYRKNNGIDEQVDIIIVRLRKLRERENESQGNLAAAIGVPTSTISNIEQSKTKLPLALAGKIAKHYHVSTDYICGITDDMVAPRNILDMFCDYLSLSQYHFKMQFPHEIPIISINKSLFDYLKTHVKAEQLKKQGVPAEVIDAWLKQEKEKAVNHLQEPGDNAVKYALLSERDITSDEVMSLLEKAYNESAGE